MQNASTVLKPGALDFHKKQIAVLIEIACSTWRGKFHLDTTNSPLLSEKKDVQYVE
jgi:hypothetical protein